MITLNFANRVGGPLSSLMADLHCVLGTTLPPSDANHPLHCGRGLVRNVKKKETASEILMLNLRLVGPKTDTSLYSSA